MFNLKTLNFVFLLLLALFSGITDAATSPAMLTSESALEAVISFTSPKTEIATVNVGDSYFTEVDIEGEGCTMVEGLPQLPTITRNLIIPWNHRASLEIINDNFSVQNAQAPPLLYSITSEVMFSDSPVSTPDIYPPQPVMASEPKTFRGNQIVTVTYYPYQYNSASGQYIYHENVEVALTYSPVDNVDLQEVPEPKTLTRDSYRMLNALTLNGPHRDDAGAALPRGGYLIVVGSAFNENNQGNLVNQLADWKRACGHHVEIAWHAEHNSVINNIMNLIRAGYQEWDPPLEYVCIIGAFGAPSGPTSAYSDVKFGFLEGNDYQAELAVGRLSATNPDDLQVAITRILSYQADPWLGNMGWFNLAGGIAEQVGGWTASVNHSVKWIAEAARRAGHTDVRTCLTQEGGGDPRNIANDWLRARANIIFQRGLNFGAIGSYQANNFPVYLACGGGHVREAWTNIWNGGAPNDLRGPSAISGSSHNQSTVTCNVLLSSMARVLLLDKLPLGWSRAYATAMLEYGGVQDRYGIDYYTNDFGYYGDPAQLIWCGRPDRIEVTHPETIAEGSNRLVVEVDNVDQEIGAANALVTLTQPGELLAYGYTDENGTCIFEIDPDWEGEIILTVTADGLIPYHTEIPIEEADLYLGAFVSSVTEIEGGNENGTLNPGETVSLDISVHNYGSEDVARDITATITSTSPFVTIENGEMAFGEVQPGDDIESEDHPTLSLSSSAPENADLRILVNIRNGNQQFVNFLPIAVEGPSLEFVSVVNGSIVDQDISSLNVRVKNAGSLDSPDLLVELASESWIVQVLDAESNFDAIRRGTQTNLDGERFLINASTIAIPGSKAPMMLLIRVQEEDIPDTLRFELQVGRPSENKPFGPDGYGYVCMDASDDEWDLAPEYEWIEISRTDDERDFNGTALPGNRVTDFATEIRLPFTFQYYGENFDRAAISENGFIAMGANIAHLVNADNYPLDRNVGGSFGMIAPYWDDLRVSGNTANIYTHYDADGHVFIIEWYRVAVTNGNGEFTFQIILYDPEFYPFTSGDGMILFQYKQVQNPVQGIAPFYFSTGICSPDGKYGINYTSNNQYPVTSARIANRHAILFTTAPFNLTGTLSGIVTDVETGEPIERAMVWTSYAQVGITDAEGRWSIEDAWASEFSITAGKQGFNDSTLTDLSIEEDEELEINFALLHPEILPSHDEFIAALPQEESIQFDFEITNTGNGPLNWYTEKHLRGGADRNPWELREQITLGQRLDDTRLQGVAFVNDHFYISGANNREPLVYVLNREFELVNEFPQFLDGVYGMKDLTWDGEWLWGSGHTSLYAFTTEGELMREFRGPFNPNNNLTWDEDREVMWVSSTTSNIVGIDREGNVVADLNRCGLRMYGLGYYRDDLDGFPLYIYHKDTELADLIVTKMNPETGDTLLVEVLEPPNGGEGDPAGSFITNSYDVYSWVYMAMVNDGPDDRLDIWQIDSRRDWFDIAPTTGTIDAGQSQDYVVTLDSEFLPAQVRFEGDILFRHNATGGEFTLPVTLDVIGGLREVTIEFNEGWNQISINVTPDDLDFPALLSPLVEENLLIFAKDGAGRFYAPEQGFCNIPNWNAADGYQISVTAPCELTLSGEFIEANTPIQLTEGWNLNAYFPTQAIDAITALSGIHDQLTIAKDGLGFFYVPEFEFSNMGNLVELQGYQYKVTEDVQLIYRVGGNDEEFLASSHNPAHFSLNNSVSGKLIPSNVNMSVLAICESALSGFEIGAFTESGQLIGSGYVDQDGRCGLAVWGDDPATDIVEGASPGEKISYKLWDGILERDVTLTPIQGEPVWTQDGFIAGQLQLNANQPVEFGVYQCYPNPVNGPVRLVFGMPEDGFVSAVLYDLSGRQIVTLFNSNAKTGYNDLTWNTTDVSSGVYVIQFKMAGKVNSSKIVVMK